MLLVRAKVARDVIPTELRKAGAHVDVVEAYETVVPQSSRARLRAALKNPRKRPHVVTFTSSSTVRNFVELLGSSAESAPATSGWNPHGLNRPGHFCHAARTRPASRHRGEGVHHPGLVSAIVGQLHIGRNNLSSRVMINGLAVSY